MMLSLLRFSDVCLEFWTDQLLNASTQERHEDPQHEPAENQDGPIPKRPQGTAGHVDQDTPANAVIVALKLPQPNALACLNGGTAELSDDLKADLSPCWPMDWPVSPRRMPSLCSLVAPTPKSGLNSRPTFASGNAKAILQLLPF
jgi:hypothetical protein